MTSLTDEGRYILDSGVYAKLTESPDAEMLVWRHLHQRIIAGCAKLWQCVRDVLCNDSPEGYFPEHDGDVDIDTKDVLSYAWRALKESR